MFIGVEHTVCIQLLITETHKSTLLSAYNVNKPFPAKYIKIDVIGTRMYITYGGWVVFKVDILLNVTKLFVNC